jgi:murein L,D-transpeptidase YcbB/YkuD
MHVEGLALDSAVVAAFPAAHALSTEHGTALQALYQRRAYRGAWIDAQGHLTSAGENLLGLVAEQDSLMRGVMLERDTLLDRLVGTEAHAADLQVADPAGTELALTAAFLRHAERTYGGLGAERVRRLDWFVPVHKKDLSELLIALCSDSADIAAFEPVHPQYQALKAALRRYQAIEARGGWRPIAHAGNELRKGDRGAAIPEVRARLAATGDIAHDDRSDAFDTGLEQGIRRFQRRYGLDTTGRIDARLITEMNRPIGQRVRQLMLNMERLRWLDGTPPQDYLLVNIPEYKLHAFENGREVWDMVVVVGSTATRTEIFRGDLSTVVLAPYWYVPQSIVDKSVKPGMRKDPRYLERMRMEVVSQKPFAVRQKPGEFNSLGLAKFLFPNSFSIYLHDTPSKNLFDRTDRAFSHGCVRVKEPARLAAYLLRDQPAWSPEAIDKAMHGGVERAIKVSRPLPVVILYLTAWVDKDGLVNFRDDVYGRDERLARELFVD